MSFSFGLRDLADPKKRLIMGVMFIALGVFCVIGKGWYNGIERTDCVMVDVTFDDCKYRSDGDGGIDVHNVYLTFDDYSSDLDIHSSCANDKLIEKLMNLKSGTNMKLLINDKTKTVYEIKVGGEIWLDFEDAKEAIEKNINIIQIVAYVLLVVGVVLIISATIPLIFRKKTSNCEDFV